MLVFIFFSTFARENIIKVGSINSLCLILELFSRSNFKLKRERSELRDRVNLQFKPKRIQKMAKRRPIEQREQKPNLFGLCRVASEEEVFTSTIIKPFDGGNL